jgi:hypothetical protein
MERREDGWQTTGDEVAVGVVRSRGVTTEPAEK